MYTYPILQFLSIELKLILRAKYEINDKMSFNLSLIKTIFKKNGKN